MKNLINSTILLIMSVKYRIRCSSPSYFWESFLYTARTQ